MATTAPAPKAAPADTTPVLLLLADGPQPVKDVVGQVERAALVLAVARGEVEFGKTKYVVTGNPSYPVTVHNGISLPPPSVVIEGGVEWPLPNERWRPQLAGVLAEALPVSGRYQKYQLEVCVNKERDVWEWLPEGEPAAGRETRYARRDIKREEAERLFVVYVRLTERGTAALTA